VKTVTGVSVGIKEFPEWDMNNFLHLPVWQEMFLAIDPRDHGIQNASKHEKVLRRHGT
jgi:hypothetical protein